MPETYSGLQKKPQLEVALAQICSIVGGESQILTCSSYNLQMFRLLSASAICLLGCVSVSAEDWDCVALALLAGGGYFEIEG